MSFAHPLWLLSGSVCLVAMVWVWRVADARQRKALQQLISPQLRVQLTQSLSGARRIAKRTLFAAALGLLFVALAGPRAGYRWEEATRRGNDIVFAVDTSRSMSTPDVKPNRLARAKLAIDDFVGRLNGDAVGLVAFAGTAFLQSPITLDYGAFRESLAALDTGIIPRGGTNITSAILAARAALQHRPGSDKVLILVTDGEDLEGDSLAAAKAAAQQDGLKIFTVGVGSANGDLIPLPADQGGGFLKDRDGHLVKSRLDESALKALAAATGGTYAPLGVNNEGLDSIYQAALAPLAKHELAARSEKVFTQRFQWPLGLSLALLVASLLMGTRRSSAERSTLAEAASEQLSSDQRLSGATMTRQHVGSAARLAATRGGAASSGSRTTGPGGASRFALPSLAAALTGSYALLSMHSAHASPAAAANAYAHGDFGKAQKEYSAALARDPKQPVLQFDAGAAAYKAGAYDQAVKAFQASVDAAQSGSAKRLAEQEDAYYNLGNTLYREGQKTRQNDSQETIENWTHAVKSYDAALQLRGDDADSKYNRDLVQRQLDALKKQQSQQSQQSKSQAQSSPQQARGQPKAQQGQPPQQAKQGPQSQGQPAQSQQGQQPDQARQGRQPQGQPKAQRGDQPQGQPNQAQQGQQLQDQPNQAQQGQQPQGQPNESQAGQQSQMHANQPVRQGEQKTPSSPGGGPQPRPDRDQGPGGVSGEQTANAADDQRQPGGMSRQEARELLDSVKDEERRPPSEPVARNSATVEVPDEPLKDW